MRSTGSDPFDHAPGGAARAPACTLEPSSSVNNQMGICPTDTFPALVCDVDARKAVERLYAAKGMSPKKQLAILVRDFAQIQAYTLGFPTTGMGTDTFRLARRALPGPVRSLPHARTDTSPASDAVLLTGPVHQIPSSRPAWSRADPGQALARVTCTPVSHQPGRGRREGTAPCLPHL